MTTWALIGLLCLGVACILAGVGCLWAASQEDRAREDLAHERAQEAWDEARRAYVEDLRRQSKR